MPIFKLSLVRKAVCGILLLAAFGLSSISLAGDLPRSQKALKIMELVAGTRMEVTSALGSEKFVKKTSWGPKYSYQSGAIEIIYFGERPGWISISPKGLQNDKKALQFIGLEWTAPSFESVAVSRWMTFPGLFQVELFPLSAGTVNFFSICVERKAGLCD